LARHSARPNARATADDPIVNILHDAALDVGLATSHAELREATEKIARATQGVGIDRWPRFLADAQVRARDAAIARSAGGRGSVGTAGAPTPSKSQLAQAWVPFLLEEPPAIIRPPLKEFFRLSPRALLAPAMSGEGNLAANLATPTGTGITPKRAKRSGEISSIIPNRSAHTTIIAHRAETGIGGSLTEQLPRMHDGTRSQSKNPTSMARAPTMSIRAWAREARYRTHSSECVDRSTMHLLLCPMEPPRIRHRNFTMVASLHGLSNVSCN
jgi:hypothetical protein